MPSTTWLTPALVSRLEALRLSVSAARAGAKLGGRFAVNRRGSSIEFADHAPYYPGDDIRAIDWSLYARLERFFVKTYKEEIELSVELLIDASASMGLPSAEKFTQAKRLAVCLGYIALAARHHVRVSWIRPDPISATRWFHKRSDLVPLLEAVEPAVVGGPVALEEWTRRAASVLRMRGGQGLLLTDGMVRPAELFRATQWLRSRHVDLRLIQLLTPQELHPDRLSREGWVVDVETGARQQLGYSAAQLVRAVAEHNELLARYCKREGMAFAQYRLDESLETFLFRTLPRYGFLE